MLNLGLCNFMRFLAMPWYLLVIILGCVNYTLVSSDSFYDKQH